MSLKTLIAAEGDPRRPAPCLLARHADGGLALRASGVN